MITQVRLKDALKAPEVYGNISRCTINFNPETGDEILSDGDIGMNIEVQFIRTQYGLSWYPFLYKDRVYLISGPKECCTTINLDESIGTKGETEVLKKHSKMYNNATLGAKGVPLTAKMLEAMPAFLRRANRRYFVSNKFKFSSRGLWYVDFNNAVKFWKPRNFFLHRLQAELRPVVELPSNVLVTLGDDERDGKTFETGLELTRY